MSNTVTEDPWKDRYAAGWVREQLREILDRVDDTDFPVAALDHVDDAIALLEDWMEALVVLSRDYDFSWEDIASGLRITRQAAWSRWRDLEGSQTQDPAVIELLVGIGAGRVLERRSEDAVSRLAAESGEPVGDREAIIRYVERRRPEAGPPASSQD